jgi:hypothetical protein
MNVHIPCEKRGVYWRAVVGVQRVIEDLREQAKTQALVQERAIVVRNAAVEQASSLREVCTPNYVIFTLYMSFCIKF